LLLSLDTIDRVSTAFTQAQGNEEIEIPRARVAIRHGRATANGMDVDPPAA